MRSAASGAAAAEVAVMLIERFWRKGTGTAADPDNGRLIWRILGIHPSEWHNYAGDPPDLWRTPMGWVRLLGNELTRYCCEVCQRCGRRVGSSTGSWWHAPDDLWITVMGHAGGVLCPRCFTEACDRRGIRVSWAVSTEAVS